MSLFHELQRRKVVRTTIAYLAAAFVAAQAAQLIVEGLDLPSWILKGVLIALIIALPLVVGLAWAFDVTDKGIEVTGDTPSAARVAVPWQRIALPVTASVLLLLTIVAFFSLNRTAPSALNHNLVAIMPFHVSGDPEIAYLRDGMVDLLAAKLTGEGGPRAVDPRAVMSVLNQAVDGSQVSDSTAVEVAREIGSGLVLVGTVVGTPAQFRINARLLRLPGGRVIAEAEEEASSTTLLASVDRLVAKLLSLQAGESLQRLDVLTTTSLPALRAYLEAQSEYRSSHFGRASELFGRALELDSTFVLAALGQNLASVWGEGPTADFARLTRIMRANIARLGPVDRALVKAHVGEAGVARTYAQRLAEFEALVDIAPDRADAWFLYADLLSHWGSVADREGWKEAVRGFDRVLKIDSSYIPAVVHLVDNAIYYNDLPRARKLDKLREARDSNGTAAVYQRALRIRAFGDSAAVRVQRAAIDTMGVADLRGMGLLGIMIPGGVGDALRAVEEGLKDAASKRERMEALSSSAMLFSIYGMPTRATRALQEMTRQSPEWIEGHLLIALSALYANGDAASARAAVAALEPLLPRVTLRARSQALCVRGQWRLWNGDSKNYRETALELAKVPADSAIAKSEANVCVQTLATIHAMVEEPRALSARTQALNALLRDGPAMNATFRNAANIVLARAAERTGDTRLAYQAVSRIPYHPNGMWLFGTMLRESARLAAANGDTATAVLNYTRYLWAHERAEPALRAVDDAARAHLAWLTGEKR